MSETSMRFITILGIILFVGTIFIFGNYFSFIISIFLISTYAFYEWITITSKSKLHLLLFLILISLIYYSPYIDIMILSYTSLAIWIVFIGIMLFNVNFLKYLIRRESILIGLFIFTSFFCILTNFFLDDNSVSEDMSLIDSKYYLLFFIMLLSSVDISSYLFGKRFGSLKVVSKISPNKTAEGYLGGYISTIVIYITLCKIFQIPWLSFDILYLTIFILLAFSGDLFISLVKRTYEIKDTGNLLPGHGGLLDRIDSYLPSISLFYIWMVV